MQTHAVIQLVEFALSVALLVFEFRHGRVDSVQLLLQRLNFSRSNPNIGRLLCSLLVQKHLFPTKFERCSVRDVTSCVETFVCNSRLDFVDLLLNRVKFFWSWRWCERLKCKDIALLFYIILYAFVRTCTRIDGGTMFGASVSGTGIPSTAAFCARYMQSANCSEFNFPISRLSHNFLQQCTTIEEKTLRRYKTHQV